MRCYSKFKIGNLLYFTGKDGKETSKITLDKVFHDDFKRNEKDTYKEKGEDVGDIVMTTLNNNRKDFKSDWYIAKITVEKEVGGHVEYVFPCYRWIVHQLVIYEGKGTWSYFELPPPLFNMEIKIPEKNI